ncbi:P-loop NTPase [Bifidobacterium sp. SMA15]|uniref:P-loop NTPase n=2 Tax=Bifidobacterium platyrrhinorum TaxID=2661628 RepID=A0A6L9SU49_9BIFI|nr:P-loop NTPase [Bifidobacterium platyrrhinorum]
MRTPARPQPAESPVPLPRLGTGGHGRIVTFTSPSGGVGLSTMVALTGLTLAKRGIRCAMLDADLSGGGLDVLLGIEHEPGLTLQDLDAPLGRIEGDALNHELPQWEGLRVLSHSPWRGDPPDWWELQAAIEALGEANDVVLVDAGRGEAMAHAPELACSRRVVAIELSVLGMARAKAHLAGIDRLEGSVAGGDCGGDPLIVGMSPRGASRRASDTAVAMAEVIAYLGDDVLGPVRCVPSLCADILAGLGIRSVPRRNRRVIDAIADWIDDGSERSDRRERGRKGG